MRPESESAADKFPADRQRMEIEQDGHVGYLTYSVEQGILRIWYVEVPAALQGRGLGGELVRKALAYAEGHGLTVEAICSFAASYVAKSGVKSTR